MPKYSFENNLFFSIWGGQHTIPADSGLPKPPCHTAHCVGCDKACGSHHTSVRTNIYFGPNRISNIIRLSQIVRIE